MTSEWEEIVSWIRFDLLITMDANAIWVKELGIPFLWINPSVIMDGDTKIGQIETF